jgi:PBP1b-binding outer membrane lipoprotein LpoB
MKTMRNLTIMAIVVFLSSCASTAKFPVSEITPAADITAKKTQDKNNNYVIELTARNLAEPNRLDPPKNNYSVWIVSGNNQTKNVGQLSNKNAKKASLKTTTAFNVKEIFITAEDQGNLTYPEGEEISRTTFSK